MNFEKLTEYLDSLEEKYGIPANDCKVTKEHEVNLSESNRTCRIIRRKFR